MFANVIRGQGTLEKSNGNSYEGEFDNGVYNGEGKF